jgi:hypothetical protein
MSDLLFGAMVGCFGGFWLGVLFALWCPAIRRNL